MNMDEKIKIAFENATPDVLDSVLSDCRKEKGAAMTMKENKTPSRISRILTTAAAAVLLIGVGAVAATMIGTGFKLNPSSRGDEPPVITGSEGTEQDILLERQSALDVALKHAGLIQDAVSNVRIELDRDNGTTHYDVSFCDGVKDYEYEIHSRSGEILEFDAEPCEDSPIGNTVGPMTADEAIEYALSHTGLQREDVNNLICERDDDDGLWRYDIEFVADGTKYDCLINAVTGDLLELEKEPANIAVQGGSSKPVTDEAQRAVDAALAEVAWTMKDVIDLSCELDTDSGTAAHYDIEFVAGGVEYDIEVHAETFAILKVEKELLDDIVPDNDSTLTMKEAVDLALENFGFTRDDVIIDLSCEIEQENGVTVYEVEFEVGGIEYSVKVCDTPSGIQIIGGIDD